MDHTVKTKVAIEKSPCGTNRSIDSSVIRKDFPILSRKINGRQLIYLDNAATTQKPQTVIDAIGKYYTRQNSNVHRGLHTLAEESTSAFEATRDKVRAFINASKTEEIIYTRGTTEAINLVAYSWGRKNIQKGDRIVTTQMEHHANLIPWIMLAKETGAELEYIPMDSQGYLDLSQINNIITPNTKLVAVTHMSNVLGTINPVAEIGELAHKNGAVFLVDGAQAVPHMQVNVAEIDADFYAFSGHKMLGPTGIGILYGKEEILEETVPFNLGGEMISSVSWDDASWNVLPWKFEAGTPHIEGAVAFDPAIEYLSNLGMQNIRRHEMELTEYCLNRLSELKNIQVFGPLDISKRGGAVSFIDSDVHSHDIATFLDTRGIAVRAGHHCAQPLTRLLGVSSTTRASFYIYNTKNEIDQLIDSLKEMRRYFGYE